MKYIKLFILMAVALPFFTSCSEDDDVNTRECTVGFESATVSLDEASGLAQIPITVSGRRNGPIRLKIETAPVGENGAVEGTNYLVTDKTLNLNADTLSSGTIYVEVKTLDDTEMNADRPFTITIVSAEGAEVTTNQTTVTIYNNDGYYKSLFGEWTLSAIEYVPQGEYLVPNGIITCDVTLGGAEDETDPNYESVLTATINNMLGEGETLNFEFSYLFNALNRGGSVGWYMGAAPYCPAVTTSSTGTPLYMIPALPDGLYIAAELPGTWSLGENGEPATEISFAGCQIYLGAVSGTMVSTYKVWDEITLIRKQ